MWLESCCASTFFLALGGVFFSCDSASFATLCSRAMKSASGGVGWRSSRRTSNASSRYCASAGPQQHAADSLDHDRTCISSQSRSISRRREVNACPVGLRPNSLRSSSSSSTKSPGVIPLDTHRTPASRGSVDHHAACGPGGTALHANANAAVRGRHEALRTSSATRSSSSANLTASSAVAV